MPDVLNFKADPRISPEARSELRDFASTAGQRVEALADRLGLLVVEEDLPSDVSAVLIESPSCGSASGFRIAVNRHHPYERRRLSIAHEIAHFVLHRKDSDFCAVREKDNYREVVPLFQIKGNSFRSGHTAHRDLRREREADKFAVCLLMPAHLVRKNANFRNGVLKGLARDFAVSLEAMRLRTREIGVYTPRTISIVDEIDMQKAS